MSNIITYTLLFFIMAVWGVNVVAIKILVENFPPVIMQSVRIFIAGLVVILVLLSRVHFRKLSKKEWLYTLMAGLLGVVGHHFFLAVGLVETTAANAALILALVPISTSVLAILFLNDRLTILRLVGICIGFIGVSFVILQGNGGIVSISIGDLYVLLAMITQACAFIFIKKVTDTLDSKQVTAIMFIIGSISLLILSLYLEPQGISTMGMGETYVWVILFASAILATGLGHMLYNSAIHQIGAGQSAIFINLTPFFALIASAIFLGEKITMSQVIGFILIIIGVILGTGYLDMKLTKNKLNEAQKDG
jgi:drug/metabolite transporter (DMT)-like permease